MEKKPEPTKTTDERLEELEKKVKDIELRLFHEDSRAKIKLIQSKEKQ